MSQAGIALAAGVTSSIQSIRKRTSESTEMTKNTTMDKAMRPSWSLHSSGETHCKQTKINE